MKIILVASILLLSLVLRLHNYSIYPQRGATSDEYAFAFLGVSLLGEGQPISWSAIPLYKDLTHLTINKLYFPIVKPYLDHPPLYGLLVGGWSILNGGDTIHKVDLKIIRIVPIFLSLVSSIFLFLIGQRLYGFKTGLWALLIYTTATIFVINSRVVVAESLVTTVLLITLFTFSIFSKNLSAGKMVLLGALCGLAFLAKVLGMVVFLTVVYFLITGRVKRKLVLTFMTTFAFFVMGFIVYGLHFGADLFWKIQLYQGDRIVGPQTLWHIITTPLIVNKVFYDGWYFFGLFSLLFVLSDYRKYKFIIVPSVIYLLLLITSLTKTDLHGWYVLPLFPFMALATASLLADIAKRSNWMIVTFLLPVGISQIQFLYEDQFGLTPSVFRLLIFILFAPFILTLVFKRQSLFTLLANAWFYIFILGNVMTTLQYVHPA